MASHPSPFNRKRQSTKSLDGSGHTAKFLYEIIKQVDLKYIDWNLLANNLGISNGHAARMRYSRFRAQMEGHNNSYAPQRSKKQGADKKRKAESDSESETTFKPRSWDSAVVGSAGTTTEPGQNQSTHDEQAMQYHIAYGRNLAAISRNEGLASSSVIDGVAVHHPSMTMIATPASSSASTTGNPQIGMRQNYRPASNMAAPTISMLNQQREQSYGTSMSASTDQWPQQYMPASYQHPYFNPNVPFQTPQNTSAPTLQSYGHHHRSNNMYGARSWQQNWHQQQCQQQQRQSQQQQYQYRHHPQQMSRYQPYVNRDYNTFPANTVSWSHGTPNNFARTPAPTNDRYSNVTYGQVLSPAEPLMSAQATVSLDTDLQSSTGAHARELAAHASYPWPYSESSLSQFVPSSSTTTTQTVMQLPNIIATARNANELAVDNNNADEQMFDMRTDKIAVEDSLSQDFLEGIAAAPAPTPAPTTSTTVANVKLEPETELEHAQYLEPTSAEVAERGVGVGPGVVLEDTRGSGVVKEEEEE